MIRTLLVDDEPLAREGLRIRLADVADVEVIGACGSGREAVEAIHELAPDLVFLDVQMPGLDGFDVLAEIGTGRMPYLIFVTAYEMYALRAFECDALDYLLKPLDPDRLMEALDRARRQLQQHTVRQLDDRIGALLAAMAPSGLGDRFVVKMHNRVVLLPVEDVDWVEAAGDYVKLYRGATSYPLRETMSRVATRLPARFVRIHRSTIVNLDRVSELRPLSHGEYTVHLHDGTRLKLSRSYRPHVQEAFGLAL